MKHRNCKFFLWTLLFAIFVFCQVSAATKKMETLNNESLSFTFTTPYNPNYLENRFAADLIYPVTNFNLDFSLSVPETPAMSNKEKNVIELEFTRAVYKFNNHQMYNHFDKFVKGPLAKAEKVFFDTEADPSSKTSLTKRSAALKTLNSEFVKAVTGFEETQSFKSLLQNIRSSISKVNPNARVTHSFMINELTLPPKNSNSLSSLFGKNTDRSKVIALLPKFSMITDNDKTLWAKIPQIVYMDFPCNYLITPNQPEIKALIKAPHNLGDMTFFDASYSFPYQFWQDERSSDIFDSEKKKTFYGIINECAKLYAERLFDKSKAITKEEFLKLQKKMNDAIVSHKSSYIEKMKKSLFDAAPNLKNTKSASTFGLVVENEFTLPDSNTGFSLRPPDEIDLDEDISKSGIKTKTDKLLSEYKALHNELKKY